MRHDEDDLQEDVIKFMRASLPEDIVFFAVPNGGRRNPREGARLKRQGVLAGVADLIVLFPRGDVLFIELKVGRNSQQATQKTFEQRVNGLGIRLYHMPLCERCRGCFKACMCSVRAKIKGITWK